jgi:hypothetical protein
VQPSPLSKLDTLVNAQINIRSAFVRYRVGELQQRASMTATQIVEAALSASPPTIYTR